MASTAFFRKKDCTAEEFFERLGQLIPIFPISWRERTMQSQTSDGTVEIRFWNDDDVPHGEVGPRARETIIRLVQGEESGWQRITVENYGYGVYLDKRITYVRKIIANEFGGVSEFDIEFPWEEYDEEDDPDLTPEVLALDPDNPIRAYFLSIATPEEREEAQRIYAEDERKRREQAEPDGRKNKKKKKSSKKLSPKKQKRR